MIIMSRWVTSAWMVITGPKIQLADAQHEIWAHWMRYLFSVSTRNADGSVTIPAEKVERWQRQIETPFDELTEKEQTSDYEQVAKLKIPFNGLYEVFSAAAYDGYYDRDVARWLYENGVDTSCW